MMWRGVNIYTHPWEPPQVAPLSEGCAMHECIMLISSLLTGRPLPNRRPFFCPRQSAPARVIFRAYRLGQRGLAPMMAQQITQRLL